MDHKTLLEDYIEDVWHQRKLDTLDRYLDESYVQHARHTAPGREGVRAFFGMLNSAFSDLAYSIDDVLSEGDRICWRWTLKARHTGPFLELPASGKSVSITGISIFRVRGGKFVEHWGEQDMLGLMQQIKA